MGNQTSHEGASYNLYYGVDRNLVQAAIRKARKERSEAMWAMVQKVFGRRADQKDDQAPVNIASIVGAGIH